MASTRIEIEHTRGLWVAEVELPRVNGGISRHRVRTETREECFAQIEDLFAAQLKVPKEDVSLGAQAIALKAALEESGAKYITMSEDEFALFIKSGAGLDIWERRTPGKPLKFEGAIFALPLAQPKDGEKWSWRPVTEGDLADDELPKTIDAPSDTVVILDTEPEPEEPADPKAPRHFGKANANGFWKKCRCDACEAKRDAANHRVSDQAAA